MQLVSGQAEDATVQAISCTILFLVDSVCISFSEGNGRSASIAACRALCVFPSIYCTQLRLKTVVPSHVVLVWACSARDAGVDALRMEALAPSAKRSRTGEAAAQPAGQAEKPAAKYALLKPLTLFAICVYMHRTAALDLC